MVKWDFLAGQAGGTCIQIKNAANLGWFAAFFGSLSIARVGIWPGPGTQPGSSASGARLRIPAPGARLRIPASGARLRIPASGARLRIPAPGARLRIPASDARLRIPASGARLRIPASGARLGFPLQAPCLGFSPRARGLFFLSRALLPCSSVNLSTNSPPAVPAPPKAPPSWRSRDDFPARNPPPAA